MTGRDGSPPLRGFLRRAQDRPAEPQLLPPRCHPEGAPAPEGSPGSLALASSMPVPVFPHPRCLDHHPGSVRR